MSEAIVTSVRFDLENYGFLTYDLPDNALDDFLLFYDGRKKSDHWSRVPVYMSQPELQEPDLWNLNGTTAIAMTPQSAEELAPCLYPVGELLPIDRRHNGSSSPMLALNITRVVDCLDLGRSDPEELLLYPDFVSSQLPEIGLFKLPQLSVGRIFHVERLDDTDSFRHRTADLRLTGLRFTELWSSERGALTGNLLAFGAP